MARATQAGSATVLSAKENVGSEGPDSGEATLLDAVIDEFGSTSWQLQLEVRPDGGAPYAVIGEFRMPNRVHKLRRTLRGTPQLRPGVVLPVAIDAVDPQRVEILWKELERSGGIEQLYGERFSLRGLIKDARAALAIPEAPTSPRPTAQSHPPIEGVDFDTYVAAVIPVAHSQIAPGDVVAHYEAHGFPVGRAREVAQAWVDRAAVDPVVAEWYHYITRT